MTYYITNGPDVLEEYTTSTSTPDKEYFYGHNGLIAIKDKTEGYFWYMKDHLGNLRQLGTNDMEIDYFPYGETRSIAGNVTQYQYAGKEKDEGIGLHYFGARYYASNIGRWYTPDPAGQGWSPYTYCAGSPIVYTDPDGEFFFAAIMIASSIYGGVKGYQETGSVLGAYQGAFMGAWTSGASYAAAGPIGKYVNSVTGSATLSMAASSTVGSTVSSVGANTVTSFGFGSYDWGNGEWSWANPFDKHDTFVDNICDIYGWLGAVGDINNLSDKMRPNSIQEAENAIGNDIVKRIKKDNPLAHGEHVSVVGNTSPVDPNAYPKNMTVKGKDGYYYLLPNENLAQYNQGLPNIARNSGFHIANLRIPGGYHLGLDKVNTSIQWQWHHDFYNGNFLFGIGGALSHGILEGGAFGLPTNYFYPYTRFSYLMY